MPRLTRLLRLSALAALALACGCRNSMRIAHLMVEADDIGHSVKQLNRAAETGDPFPSASSRPSQ
jgi:hypothetical protein